MASNPSFKQHCPHCQVALLLRDPSWIGKTVECPKCKTRFVVQDPAKPGKETLIQKDKQAVRQTAEGSPPVGDRITAKPKAGIPVADDCVTAELPVPDQLRVGLEPLYASGAIPGSTGGRGVRRKKAKAEEGGVNLSIIITPMLDMAFQLLAFFIMTYHPSALEGHIDGNLLPPSKIAIKGPTPTPDNAPPVDIEPDTKDVIVVQVKAVKRGQTEGKKGEGEPSQILLKRPEDGANATIIVDSDQDLETGLKNLHDALKTIQGKGTAKANINIEADSDLKHQYFIRVYDVCKAANFQNVGFIAPPDAMTGKKD
jgi:biopolymer transport protein ExbD